MHRVALQELGASLRTARMSGVINISAPSASSFCSRPAEQAGPAQPGGPMTAVPRRKAVISMRTKPTPASRGTTRCSRRARRSKGGNPPRPRRMGAPRVRSGHGPRPRSRRRRDRRRTLADHSASRLPAPSAHRPGQGRAGRRSRASRRTNMRDEHADQQSEWRKRRSRDDGSSCRIDQRGAPT